MASLIMAVPPENKNVLDRIDVVDRLLRDVFFFFLFFAAACKKKAQQK